MPEEQRGQVVWCAECDFESPFPAPFTTHRSWGRERRLCPACEVHRQERSGWRLVTQMLLLPIGGAALLLLQQWLPPSARPEDVARFGWLLLNLSAFLASLALIVAPHEAAHALVARVLGLRVFSVTLGIGPKLFETLLGRTRLRVNALPIAGLTMVGQRHTRWMRARVFLLTLAGPLANLVLLLASLRLTHSAALLSDLELPLDFALANALVLVANLVPYRVKANGLGTDGWMLLNVCCFWGQREVDEHAAGAYAMEAHTENQAGNLPGALDWVREGLESHPESALLSMTEGYLRVYTAEYEQARNSFLRALASPVIAPELRALVQNNLAWVNLVTSPDGRLSEADQASREACERLGWTPPLKGTRGAVLVELGQEEAGLSLLEAALRGSDDEVVPMARATYLCYRARALWSLGRSDEAARELETARAVEPRCPFIARTATRLAGTAEGPTVHGAAPAIFEQS